MPETPAITYLFRGQKYLVILGAVYVGLVGLLAIPYFQSQCVNFQAHFCFVLIDIPVPSALYLNALKFPWFADFDSPEKYGLARVFSILPRDTPSRSLVVFRSKSYTQPKDPNPGQRVARRMVRLLRPLLPFSALPTTRPLRACNPSAQTQSRRPLLPRQRCDAGLQRESEALPDVLVPSRSERAGD